MKGRECVFVRVYRVQVVGRPAGVERQSYPLHNTSENKINSTRTPVAERVGANDMPHTLAITRRPVQIFAAPLPADWETTGGTWDI